MADISQITAAGAGKKPFPPMAAKKKAPPVAGPDDEDDAVPAEDESGDAGVTESGDGTTGQDVQNLASKGRGGDNTLAHLTQGEIVIPLAAQTPELIQTLEQAFLESGLPLDRYIVGDDDNSVNPETGMPEYGLGKIFKKVIGAAAPIVGNLIAPGIGGAIGGAVSGLISGDEAEAGGAAGGTAGGGGMVASNVTPEVATAARPKSPETQAPSIQVGTRVPNDVAGLQDTLMNTGRALPTSVSGVSGGMGGIKAVGGGNDILAGVLAAIMDGKSFNPSTGIQEFYGPGKKCGPSMNPSTGLQEFWGPTDNQSILNKIYGYSGAVGQGQGDAQVRQGTYEQGKQYEAARRAAGDTAYTYTPTFDADRNKYLLQKYYGYTGTTGSGEGEKLISQGDAVARDLYTADRNQYQPGYKPTVTYAGPTSSTTNNSNNSANSLPTPTTTGSGNTAPDYVNNLINQISSLQNQINGLNSGSGRGSSSSGQTNTPAVTRVSSLSPNRSNRFRSRRYDTTGAGIARNF